MMYVFQYVERLTDNYHAGGGLLIVAESRERAKRMIAEYNVRVHPIFQSYIPGDSDRIVVTDEEWDKVLVWELAGDVPEHLMVFPDAGCC